LYRICLIAILVVAAWPAPLLAQRRDFFFNPERDLASLPRVCYVRLKGTPDEQRNWEQKLGPEIFMHVHHHCFGLYDMNRAKMGFDLDKDQKRALYRDAVGQFGYVLDRWPKDSPLYKEAERYQQEARAAALSAR
jgi:hypothetical protein